MGDIVVRLRRFKGDPFLQEAADEIEKLRDENDRLSDKQHAVYEWCNAYPIDIFPEPDFVAVRAALAEHDITIDAVSASNMRHVLDGIRKIIDPPTEGDGG
jgi:hypothetical protein